jgi:hypothetical protein
MKLIMDNYFHKGFDVEKRRDWETQFGVKILKESRLMRGFEFIAAKGVETKTTLQERNVMRNNIMVYSTEFRKKHGRMDIVGYQFVDMQLEDGTIMEVVVVKSKVDADEC